MGARKECLRAEQAFVCRRNQQFLEATLRWDRYVSVSQRRSKRGETMGGLAMLAGLEEGADVATLEWGVDVG